MGGPATYIRGEGDPIALDLIFKRAYEQTTISDGLPTTTTRPTAWVERTRLPCDPQQGDVIVVDGASWIVSEAQRESADTWKLALLEALL